MSVLWLACLRLKWQQRKGCSTQPNSTRPWVFSLGPEGHFTIYLTLKATSITHSSALLDFRGTHTYQEPWAGQVVWQRGREFQGLAIRLNPKLNRCSDWRQCPCIHRGNTAKIREWVVTHSSHPHKEMEQLWKVRGWSQGCQRAQGDIVLFFRRIATSSRLTWATK